MFAFEMGQTTTQMVANAADNAQVEALTHDLLARGITHIYSGYWQCDRFIFVTQEKLICAAMHDDMTPDLTRYAPYKAIVDADPQAVYVFPDSPEPSSFVRNLDAVLAHHFDHLPAKLLNEVAPLHLNLLHKHQLDGYAVYSFTWGNTT